MGDEVELVSDGDGVAIFGTSAAVDLFLSGTGVASKEITLRQGVSSAMNAGSGVAQVGSQLAANSGRWVKLTEESAAALKLGKAMKGSAESVSRAIATTDKGKITKILEFAKHDSVGAVLTNPAMLAGAAGIMAQIAMQQTMDEITDYLAKIDEKVDDVLRAQKDVALAEMIGVGFVIDEAMTVREHTERVSDVTWSKVQGASQTIATTQAYALRQLDALTEKLEKKQNVSDVAGIAAASVTVVEEWLAVLARCFQLQDGLAVLELDRVLDAEPAELDRHRVGLQKARLKRRDQIAVTTQNLLARIDAAAGRANEQALLHPFKANSVVQFSNDTAVDIVTFNDRIGVTTDRDALEAKRWALAAGEARDKVVEVGGQSLGTARRFGLKTFEGAKSTTEKLGKEFADRRPRRRANDKGKE